MDDDEIGDGIEDLDPVAVGPFDFREQSGIVESHGRVLSHGFQKNEIFLIPGSHASGKTKNSREFSLDSRQAHQHTVGPAQPGCRFRSQHFRGGTGNHLVGVARQKLAQSGTQISFALPIQRESWERMAFLLDQTPLRFSWCILGKKDFRGRRSFRRGSCGRRLPVIESNGLPAIFLM